MFLDGKTPKVIKWASSKWNASKTMNLNQWLNFCPNLDKSLTFPTNVAFALFLSGPNGKRSYGHLYIFLYCIGWVPCSSLFFFWAPIYLRSIDAKQYVNEANSWTTTGTMGFHVGAMLISFAGSMNTSGGNSRVEEDLMIPNIPLKSLQGTHPLPPGEFLLIFGQILEGRVGFRVGFCGNCTLY